MRLAHSPSSSCSMLILIALATACAGGSPAPAAPAAAEPGPADNAAPAATASNKPGAADDEGWVGEKSAKGDDAAKGAAVAGASDAEPSPANGKGVAETRTMEVIRKIVMDNRKAARKCYDDARKDLKDLKGDVVIHFVLDPEGKVKLAELNQERSTLKAPAVTDCVLGVIRSIHFPPSSRGMETSTNYPFNFTP